MQWALYLAFILAGITFIGLLVLCRSPTTRGFRHFDVDFSEHTSSEAANRLVESIRSEQLSKCHYFFYRDGCHLIWGLNPKPTYVDDLRFPFGLFLIPFLIGSVTTLAYVAVMR